MSYVPDGVYFGGESEEDDGYCGFDFGDSPPSKSVTFVEPSTSLLASMMPIDLL